MGKIIRHVVTETQLHCITDNTGHVHVYTQKEYNHLTWWELIKLKYF